MIGKIRRRLGGRPSGTGPSRGRGPSAEFQRAARPRGRPPGTRPAWLRGKTRRGGPNGPGGRGWWRILVEAAAVVAVPSALLYALGVLAFWLRIASEYDNVGIGTTWYAASLVPRSTAAASGIEVIARGFAYGTLLSVAALFAAHVVGYARARRRGENAGFFSAPLILPFLLLAAGMVSVLLNVFFSGEIAYGLLFNLRVVAVMILLFGLCAASLAAASWDGSLRSLLRLYPKPVYGVIVAVLAVSVFASILFPREASLPCLWEEDPKGEVVEANAAGTQSGTEPLQWTLQGGFLSKSGGTWYVLTEADWLQAMPDDGSIRVVGGDFSVRYQKIGGEGTPVGEPVPEEDMEPMVTYVAVKYCSGFPSQPTITDLGGFTVSETHVWFRESSGGE